MPFFVHRPFQWSAGLTVFLYVGLAKFARLSDQPGKRRAIRKPCPLRKIDLASTRPELVLALAREMAAALPAPH